MNKPILVFDMDGVLVDVTESYNAAIIDTVNHFAGIAVTNEDIQDFKTQGGWNDDWQLSRHLIELAGKDVPLERVTEYFQRVFLGDGTDGLIRREKWVDRTGTLRRLSQRFRFAIFTGRPKEDAEITLRRFASDLTFDPVIGMYNVENLKPAPDGLRKILNANPGCRVSYIGDTVDDARCARAARVPFIGIAAPTNPRYVDQVFLLIDGGAAAIIDDINYLDSVLQPEAQ